VVDDGRGGDDLLQLVCEVKGYRGEDAKEKKNTMETKWVPGVNNTGKFGRWAFVEFRDPMLMGDELSTAAEEEVKQVLDSVLTLEVA
jgi:type III restriction enzyme